MGNNDLETLLGLLAIIGIVVAFFVYRDGWNIKKWLYKESMVDGFVTSPASDF